MTDFSRERMEMVERQLVPRSITDPFVLKSMQQVPRHLFVPQSMVPYAYEDSPLQIGSGQTISQPYIVAKMAQEARLNSRSKVLEIGTGSGYGAAVLSMICREVFSIERIPKLAEEASLRLRGLGYNNVQIKQDDGTMGWPEEGPFDAIIVTAAGPRFPQALVDQLTIGGSLIVPVGDRLGQELMRLTKESDDSYREESLGPVRFVPLIGKQGWPIDTQER
jgi:protein-L-isoaspartate(D-aspartate) O-methyltransferase